MKRAIINWAESSPSRAEIILWRCVVFISAASLGIIIGMLLWGNPFKAPTVVNAPPSPAAGCHTNEYPYCKAPEYPA